MINRKRYYNSFFDQITEYKQHKHSAKEQSAVISHQVLGTGLLGGMLMVAFMGGFNMLPLPSLLKSPQVALVRNESRPIFNFSNNLQQTDASFASELGRTGAIPSKDAHTDPRNVRANFGFDAILYAGGSQQSRAFMAFDLSNLDSREDVVLKLYPTSEFTGTVTVYAGDVEELWEEDTLTAESAPNANGVQLSRASGTFGPNASVDFDLRDAFVDVTHPTVVVTATGTREGFAFYSREGVQPPEIRSIQ